MQVTINKTSEGVPIDAEIELSSEELKEYGLICDCETECNCKNENTEDLLINIHMGIADQIPESISYMIGDFEYGWQEKTINYPFRVDIYNVRDNKGRFLSQDKTDNTIIKRIPRDQFKLLQSLKKYKTYNFIPCRRHLKDIHIGDYLSVDDPNCDFLYCPLCSRFVNENDKAFSSAITIAVLDEEHEECDCGDRILHNNGGNYHFSYYKGIVVEIEE